MNDSSFKLFSNAYDSYRDEVINRKKLYDRYVDDFCVLNTSQVPDLLNKHGVVVRSNKMNSIKNRIQKLLETRPDLVVKYFQENTFTYKDYKQMIVEYDTTYSLQKPDVDLIEIKQEKSEDFSFQKDISNKKSMLLQYGFLDKINFTSVQNDEEKLNLIKEIILVCYSPKMNKQFGDRVFGYLIKSKFIPTITLEDQRKAWQKIFGEEMKPSNPTLFSFPEDCSRYVHRLKNKTLYDQLQIIQIIYSKIGLKFIAEIVSKDLEKMKS